MGWAVFLIVLIKVLVVFGVLMVSVMLMIWFERKVISDMQSRIGPNRAGPFGIAQTLADGIKLFFKEDLMPDQADRAVFMLAPYLTIIPAFLAFAIVPIGGVVTVAGHTFELQLADPPMGILFLLAMSSIGVYGVMLAGWSSGSKYPLLGSVRASAQMISYEAALGMTVVTVVLITGSLSAPAPSWTPRPRTCGSGTSSGWAWCPSSSSSSPSSPRPTGPPSTWSRPTPSWSAASSPSTRPSGSPCSSWPSS